MKRVLRVLLGANPWPGAGVAGHAAVAAMALVALAFLVARMPSGGWGPPGAEFVGNDFVAYFSGAVVLVTGQAQHLYDAEVQLQTQRALLAGFGAEEWGLNSYVNPPLWAAVVAILYPLGLHGADWMWRLVLLVVSAGALLAIARQGERRACWWRAALLALCFFPFVQAWHHRSMVAILLLAFGGWLALTRANRPRLAGLALSLLLLKPQYVVFPVLYLAWKRQWRQLQGWASGAAVQGGLTVLVFMVSGGLPSLDALAPFVAFDGGESGAFVEAHVTLRAAILHLFGGASSVERLVLLAITTTVVMLAVLALMGRQFRSSGRQFAWEILALAAATNLTAPHNHTTGLVLLLPPAVAILADGTRSEERRNVRFAPALAVLLALPSVAIVFIGFSVWLYVAAGWAVALGALALGLVASSVRSQERVAWPLSSGRLFGKSPTRLPETG